MPNVFKDNNLCYHYIKNYDGSVDIPNIYLMNRKLEKLGQIEDVTELKVVVSMNEPNECSFTTHKNINGNENTFWDKIKDTAVILIESFGLFEIDTPVTETETITKKIHGTDLFSSELSQCNCTLQINTDDDIARTDYDVNYPTVFYRPYYHPEASLLHRILTYAPHYSIGHVDDSLMGMNRILSCSDKSVYDFLTKDVSEAFGCLFVLDNFTRTINVYDLQDHCLTCGGHHIINNECQDCKDKGNTSTNIEQGYGFNSSIYVDTENLASSIDITGDKGSVKNCFKLEAGDDTMTDMVGQRLIGGTNYIWAFSQDTLNDMSDELRNKYTSYVSLCNSYKQEFSALWDSYNDCINKISYWKNTKFPSTSSNITSANEAWFLIQKEITYACISSKMTVLSTVSRNVLNYAKLILPKDYDVKFIKDSYGEDKTSCTTTSSGGYNIITSWTGYLHIYRLNYTDDNGNDLDYYDTGAWTLKVVAGYENQVNSSGKYTNDYYLYLKRQLDCALAKAEITGKPKYNTDYTDSVSNHLSDSDYYINYFKEYNVTSLQSFRKAYENCAVIINQLNSDITNSKSSPYYILNSGSTSNVTIYQELIGKYKAFNEYIDTLIEDYQSNIDRYDSKLNAVFNRIVEINTTCNMRNYLGETLYTELMSFKREDIYKNDNFTSDMADNDTDMIKNIEEFIVDAKQEIAKACQLRYSCNISMSDLLADNNYSDYYEYFAVGNYIRLSVDDVPVKIRITQLTFDFNNIEQMDVSLSDALVGESNISDYEKIIESAKSIATSFPSVERQTDLNNKDLSNITIKLIDEGLAAVNNMVANANNQKISIDEYGLLGRRWNEDRNAYDDEQVRIVNNDMVFTADGWQTIHTAIGRIYYNGWKYGISSQYLIGKMIIGANLEINNQSGTYIINDNGFNITKGSNKIFIDAKTPKISIQNGSSNSIVANASDGSFYIQKDGVYKLRYTPSDGLYINGNGSFTGDVIAGNSYSNVKLYSSGAMSITHSGNTLMDFNTDGQGKLVFGANVELSWNNITDGDSNVTKITKDTISTTNILAENLRVKAMNIDGTITATNVNTQTGEIGGWKINSSQLYNDTASSSYMELRSSGSIYSRNSTNAARLIGGKFIFGNYSDSQGYYETEGYADISVDGIYAKSIAGANTGGKPYLLSVDNKNDTVTITGSTTKTPALTVTNIGSGAAMRAFCSVGGADSSEGYYITMYGENATLYRAIIRCDNGDLEHPQSGYGSVGSITFPWDTVFATNGVSTSDLKEKDIISEIDKDKALDFINDLKPLNYTFKKSTSKRIHMGFGAQHVAETAKKLNMGDLSIYEAVIKDGSKEQYYEEGIDDEELSWGLKYNEFEAPMVAAIQALSRKITEMQNEIQELKKGIV